MIKRLLLSVIYLSGMAQGFLLATPSDQAHGACALMACACPAHSGKGEPCHCPVTLSPETRALLEAEHRAEGPSLSGTCESRDAKAFPASLQPHLAPVESGLPPLAPRSRPAPSPQTAPSHSPEPPQPIPD